eukprot:scaffold28174_cov34-Tisochrysis_lutea.AAC.2
MAYHGSSVHQPDPYSPHSNAEKRGRLLSQLSQKLSHHVAAGHIVLIEMMCPLLPQCLMLSRPARLWANRRAPRCGVVRARPSLEL